MTAPKSQLNAKKIILIIAVATGLVILALVNYRDATRQHLPLPLQTPLPDASSMSESEVAGDSKPAIDLAEPSEEEPEADLSTEQIEESEDTSSSHSTDLDGDEQINSDADK